MRRFLIDPGRIKSGRAWLDGSEAHHARDVLRLKTGDTALLVDGSGREYLSRIVSISRDQIEMEIIDQGPGLGEIELDLTLGLALIRSESFELVVRKGTELGLKTLVPVSTSRTVLRLDPDRAAGRLERWRRIAGQAVKQCRRSLPVEVRPVAGLPEFLSAAAGADLKVMLHQGPRLGGRNWRDLIGRGPRPRSAWVLIGPEGGFTENETALAQKKGFEIMGLGPRILRSETAALAVISIFAFELGDLA